MAKLVGAVPASRRPGLLTLRTALTSGVALALLALAGLSNSADASPRRMRFSAYHGWYVAPPDISVRRMRFTNRSRREKAQSRKELKKDTGFGEMSKGPLQIVVTIASQRVTLFSNGVRAAQGPVSTGVPGRPTPMGVFSVIEKDRYHRSNLYSNAPMPYMQRITWSGVALHEGVLPGYPASHGCIRMSHDFAQKLWPVTKLGVRVLVVRNEVAPVEFEHPKLFVPKQKPGEPQIAMNAATDGSSARVIKLAEATPQEETRAADVAPQTANPMTNAIEERKGAEFETRSVQTAKPVEDVKPPEEVAPAELRKSVEAPAASEPPAQIMPTAMQPSASEEANELVKPALTDDPPKPLAPRLKPADQPVKRSGQVAVFISRKEKKIFVRQGFVPMFDMPVVIENTDHPIGTHVFTAMGATDNGMRWNLMTIPTDGTYQIERRESRKKSKEPPSPVVHLKPPSTAAEALNRIQMPKEAVERISELLIPGSSLVVSDEGLGRETGRATEFIVLTR